MDISSLATIDAEIPSKKVISSNQEIPLDAGNFDSGKGLDEDRLVLLKTIKNENRQDWLHKTTHIMGITIISSFLLFSLISILAKETLMMPDYLVAIVSSVIGFYFGNSFREKA